MRHSSLTREQWLFGPESMMWRINREFVLILGGRAALLMQLAHPLVAAGVADHSDFHSDAVARLRRTLDSMLSIVFGTKDEAEAIAGRINEGHARVKGIAPDGRPYDALDPDLLLWVHATLADSSVRVYEALVKSLTDEERASYYEETKVVARLFAIPEQVVPATLDDLRSWMDEQIRSGVVAVTPLARELAGPIISPVPLVPRKLSYSLSILTASLLPPTIREGYGLGFGRVRTVAVAAGRFASKRLIRLVPGIVRTWPVARHAE